jgi:hypothetical protein
MVMEGAQALVQAVTKFMMLGVAFMHKSCCLIVLARHGVPPTPCHPLAVFVQALQKQ